MEPVSDDQANQDDRRSSARGEAAWKAAAEAVAQRNEAARKAGKQRREAYERQRDETRRAAEREQHLRLIAERRSGGHPSSQ
jgi:hypothetical protein